MFYAIDKMPPDDFSSGILDIILTLCSWHWNSASILYVLTPLIVSIETGEKKSFQLLLVIIKTLGAAAYSFQSETKTDFNRVKDLVMLIEMPIWLMIDW